MEKCENYAACDKEITSKQRKQKIERLKKETDIHKERRVITGMIQVKKKLSKERGDLRQNEGNVQTRFKDRTIRDKLQITTLKDKTKQLQRKWDFS